MTEPIRWFPARTRVLARCYAARAATACSRFGFGPFPVGRRNRNESAELLAHHAEASTCQRGRLRTANGERRLTLDEWAETYWSRYGGPLRGDAEACRVFFDTYRLLTWGRP